MTKAPSTEERHPDVSRDRRVTGMPAAGRLVRLRREQMEPLMETYYLDHRVSLAEGTRRFADDGRGREAQQPGFYTQAIRRRGSGEWVFRFARNDQHARSTLETLNRPAPDAPALP